MKRDQVNYVVAGGFVIVMGVAVIVSLWALTGRSGPTDAYRIHYPSVSGMKFGTVVLYEGFQVGQVERIVPRHDEDGVDYEVTIAVERGWPIRNGSVARVVSSGLISAVAIDIQAGEEPGRIEAGGEITGQARADMFAALSQAANDFRVLSTESLKPLARTLNREIPAILGDLRALTTETIRPLVENVRNRLDDPEMFADIKSLSARLNAVAGRIDSAFDPDALDRGRLLLSNLSVLSGELVETNRRVQLLIDDEAERSVSSILTNVERLSAGLVESNTRVQSLLSEDNVGNVREALAGVVGLSAALTADAQALGGLLGGEPGEGLKRTLAQLESLVGEMRESNLRVQAVLGPENRERVSGLLTQAEALASEARESNARVQAVLDDENRVALRSALRGLSQVATELGKVTGVVEGILSVRNRDHVSNILANVELTSRDLRALVGEVSGTRQRLDRLLQDAEQLVSDNRGNVDVAVGDLRRSLEVLAAHVDSFAYHLEGGSRNIHEFTRQIRENPGLLLRGSPQPDAARVRP